MKLRVFYRISNNQIVWNGTTETEFPYTIEQDIAGIPLTLIGGQPSDYACIQVTDKTTIDKFMASDGNTVINGKLVTGVARIVTPPAPPRDIPKEVEVLNSIINTGVDMATIKAQWGKASTLAQKSAVLEVILKLK